MSTITPAAQRLPKVGAWVLGYNAKYEPSKWRVMRFVGDGIWESDTLSIAGDWYLPVYPPTHFMPQPKFPPPTDTAL